MNDKYLQWICGFANAQGGRIYIGENDSHEMVGVDNPKKLMEDIPNQGKGWASLSRLIGSE